MRTGTGILTRDDVNDITNEDIWVEETTRCLTVAALASVEYQLSIHNISYTLDSGYSSNSYRLIPYNKVSFSSTPIGPTGYTFNIFGETSADSAMSSLTFSGTLVIYQGSASAPHQEFDISSDIYKKRATVSLTYQGSTINETVFNQLYFYISGGWTPNYSCNCTVFKTQGTSWYDAQLNKDTVNLVYQSSSSSTTVYTENSPCLLSSIGTYDEFMNGYLGIIIYLERTGMGGAALYISPTSWSAGASSSSKTFTAYNLSGVLSVASKPTWATVSISGSSVTVSVTANTTASTRTGVVLFSGKGTDGASRNPSIEITQAGQTSPANPRLAISADTEWPQDTTATISGYNVYKSVTIGDKSWTIFTLEVSGYQSLSPLDIYIRSYAERNYDYAIAYELDYIPEPSSYTDVVDTVSEAIASTKTNQQSGTGLASYTKVSYTIPDNNTHYISVAYRKDINGKAGDDAAYVAIPNEYLLT